MFGLRGPVGQQQSRVWKRWRRGRIAERFVRTPEIEDFWGRCIPSLLRYSAFGLRCCLRKGAYRLHSACIQLNSREANT